VPVIARQLRCESVVQIVVLAISRRTPFGIQPESILSDRVRSIPHRPALGTFHFAKPLFSGNSFLHLRASAKGIP